MGSMTIDGRTVEFTDEKNILQVIRKAGIELPTFCYHSELSIYGACRLCMVEDPKGSMMASCSTPPWDGAILKTTSARLRQHRKMILELLLASHCRDCTTCAQSSRCRLQELALRYGIRDIRFPSSAPARGSGARRERARAIDASSPAVVRDPGKCILCGDCVRVCSEKQNMGVLDFMHRGSDMVVAPAFEKPLAESDCISCGQCAAVCPTGALTIRSHKEQVYRELGRPGRRLIAQIAPAVRVALGEEFGEAAGESVMGRMVAALRHLGFHEVYDTSAGADLTVMEEADELLARLGSGERLPLFTSCCPAWAEYMRVRHPDMAGHLSSCKSPMAMLGAVLKAHYRNTRPADSRETVMVAIMPCTAKKAEAARPALITDGERDVDYVLTTQELADMIAESGLVFSELEPEACDMPFSLMSGAGVIFGVTGGVTEAVLRRLDTTFTPAALAAIAQSGVRGPESRKLLQFEARGRTLSVAVVHGLSEAESLIQDIRAGRIRVDFVEVMACPEGCVGGAGQPVPRSAHLQQRARRARGIYHAGSQCQIRRSEENPMLNALYGGVIRGRQHQLLHVAGAAARSEEAGPGRAPAHAASAVPAEPAVPAAKGVQP